MAVQAQLARWGRDLGVAWLVMPTGDRSRRRRFLGRGLAVVIAGLVGLGGLLFVVVFAGAWLVSNGVSLLSRGTVWVVLSMADGVSLWALLGEVLGRVGSVFTTPAVAASLVGLEGIAVVVLYALHRTLRLGRAGGKMEEEDT